MLGGEGGACAWELRVPGGRSVTEQAPPSQCSSSAPGRAADGPGARAGRAGKLGKDWAQATRATECGGGHTESNFVSGNNMWPLGSHSDTFFWLLSRCLYQPHDCPDTKMLGMEATSGGRNKKNPYIIILFGLLFGP